MYALKYLQHAQKRDAPILMTKVAHNHRSCASYVSYGHDRNRTRQMNDPWDYAAVMTTLLSTTRNSRYLVDKAARAAGAPWQLYHRGLMAVLEEIFGRAHRVRCPVLQTNDENHGEKYHTRRRPWFLRISPFQAANRTHLLIPPVSLLCVEPCSQH